MIISRLVLLLLCLLPLPLLRAQVPLHYRQFTERDGLSDTRITVLLRDAAGFLWVGTENGLNRFDGYRFRNWRPGDGSGYPGGEIIYDLKQDRSGHIWIATNNGLCRLDPQQMRFRFWQAQGGKAGSLPNPIVTRLHLDETDALWLVCDNQGLCSYDADRDVFVHAQFREALKELQPEIPADAHLSFYELRGLGRDSLLVAGNTGFWCWDRVKGRWTAMPVQDPLPQAQQACADRLWLGTWDQDLLSWNPCQRRWEQLRLPMDASLTGGRRQTGTPVRAGSDWLVPAREGLFRVDAALNASPVLPDPEGRRRLPAGPLNAALHDSSGTVWLGGTQGLCMAAPQVNAISWTRLSPPGTAKNFYNTWTGFLPLGGDSLLALDFYEHRLHLMCGRGEIRRYLLPEKGGMLEQDAAGRIWVAGGSALFTLNRHSLTLEPAHPPGWDVQQRGFFTDVVRDGSGNLWLGHTEAGLQVLDAAGNLLWRPGQADGFLSTAVNSLVWDARRGCIWVATPDYGLYRCDLRRRTCTLYEHQPQNPYSLGAYTVGDVCVDAAGRVWAATDPGGVSLWLGGDRFLNLGTAQGMPGNRVISLAEDRTGRIWAGTLNGLACIDPDQQRIAAFTDADGLPQPFMDMPLLLRGGELLNGTIYGVQRIRPEKLLPPATPAKVRLTALRIQGRALADSVLAGLLQGLDLGWKESFLQAEFAPLAIETAADLRWAFRLKGLQEDWMHTGAEPACSFAGVPPGEYVLEVRAGHFFPEREPVFRLPVRVHPPFWQTGWFRILATCLLAALFWAAWRLRIRQVRREETLKADFNRRLAQTEMAALRAQMNPHFVFNCLSSINRFILVNQPDTASEYLTQFSRLIRLILDNSRTDTVLLSRELEALRLYILMEQMRFSDAFDYEIAVDPALQPEHTEIPPLLIQPYVENAIWHGLMHKQGPRKLRIRVQAAGQGLRIEIEDNGVGRAMAASLKSRSATADKSHGMRVTSERIDAINRIYGTAARVETVDLTDPQGQASGTRIILYIDPIRT